MSRQLTWPVFWALVGVSIVIVSLFFVAAFVPAFRGTIFLGFLLTSGAVFLLLGAALIFFTVREKVEGMLKKFLLLTGASAVGVLLFVLLQNEPSDLLL